MVVLLCFLFIKRDVLKSLFLLVVWSCSWRFWGVHYPQLDCMFRLTRPELVVCFLKHFLSTCKFLRPVSMFSWKMVKNVLHFNAYAKPVFLIAWCLYFKITLIHSLLTDIYYFAPLLEWILSSWAILLAPGFTMF